MLTQSETMLTKTAPANQIVWRCVAPDLAHAGGPNVGLPGRSIALALSTHTRDHHKHATRVKSAVVLEQPIRGGVHGKIRNVELVARIRGLRVL